MLLCRLEGERCPASTISMDPDSSAFYKVPQLSQACSPLRRSPVQSSNYGKIIYFSPEISKRLPRRELSEFDLAKGQVP